MASRSDRRRTTGPKALVPAVAALALSAAALYFGTGLTPVAALTWVAPLPVLLLAPRVSPLVAALVAFGAWLVGELNLWTYLTGLIELPVPVVAGLFLGLAALFAAVVLAVRALILRGRPFAAALALPALWVSAEYLFSILSPDGAFWSLAYTQAGVLPVVQVAALTGYWGITFLLLLAPATVAVLCAPGVTRPQRARLGAGVTALLVLAVGLGAGRLDRQPPTGATQRVSLLAARQDGGRVDVTTVEGRALLDGYVREADRAVARGARIVVLPEAVFRADPATVPLVTGPLAAVARRSGATIVVGVAVVDPAAGRINGRPGGYNTAQILSGTQPPVAYRKQHLIVTEPYEPGHELAFVPGEADWAVAVCKDLDFPALARDYRRAGARVLLVPAWDFDRDAWLHSRMAVLRGVENGIPVVRSARSGALTVSDSRGRVTAEDRTGDAPFVTVTVDLVVVGVSTPYTVLGPWFAWLCLVLCLGLTTRLRRRAPAAGPLPAVVREPAPIG